MKGVSSENIDKFLIENLILPWLVRREIVYIADMEIPALLYWQLDDDKCISYVDPGVFSYVMASKKWPNPATYLNTQRHKKRFLCLLYFPKARFKLLEFKDWNSAVRKLFFHKFISNITYMVWCFHYLSS